MSWLESQIERQPEAAARRKRRQVHEARDEIPAVVHFRVKAVVPRNNEQIPAREADLRNVWL